MTEDEQLAESVKYSSAVVWHFAEIKPNVYALYDYERHPVLITSDWNELLACYKNRPVYVPKVRATHYGIDVSQIDLSLLEFTL